MLGVQADKLNVVATYDIPAPLLHPLPCNGLCETSQKAQSR